MRKFLLSAIIALMVMGGLYVALFSLEVIPHPILGSVTDKVAADLVVVDYKFVETVPDRFSYANATVQLPDGTLYTIDHLKHKSPDLYVIGETIPCVITVYESGVFIVETNFA